MNLLYSRNITLHCLSLVHLHMYVSFDMLCTYYIYIYAYNVHTNIEASLYLNLISWPYLKNVLQAKERVGMPSGAMLSKHHPHVPKACL